MNELLGYVRAAQALLAGGRFRDLRATGSGTGADRNLRYPTGDADVFQRQFDGDAQSGAVSNILLGVEVERMFSDVLKKCLARTPPVFIRASDALHIATALAEGETEFVTPMSASAPPQC